MTDPVVVCPACKAKNRIPVDAKSIVCGKCKRPFTIREIVAQFRQKEPSLFEKVFG